MVAEYTVMRRLIQVLLFGLVAAFAVTSASAAFVNYTNSILTVETENAGTSAGMFWVRTGSSHPKPNQNILFHTETSNFTLRDLTASEIWTNAVFVPNVNIPGFVSRSMQLAPATAVVTNLPTGFRMTYTLPNWVVVQDVVVIGTTLADSNVRQTVTVTNTSGVSRSWATKPRALVRRWNDPGRWCGPTRASPPPAHCMVSRAHTLPSRC
jgi:hypothetical protein